MGGVTASDHLFEVPILRLYDLVGGLALVPEIAGTT
jgi:hypothetical protein